MLDRIELEIVSLASLKKGLLQIQFYADRLILFVDIVLSLHIMNLENLDQDASFLHFINIDMLLQNHIDNFLLIF